MINQDRLRELLSTSYFGKYLYILSEVDSTNSYAREAAREGAPEGSVIIADYQAKGRGRLGRVWESEAGTNILMSIILRPRISIQAARCITLASATILIKALQVFLNIDPINHVKLEVKWPNDILLNGKKVAGILTESSVKNQSIEYIITGIGINVNQKSSDFSDEIKDTAISLYDVTSKQIERERLIAQILSIFEKYYIRLERINYADIVKDWKAHWGMAGRAAKIETPVTTEWGEILDINENGSLLYKTEDGLIKEMVTGNIYPE
jgi:BirA family biotin operon repressor/biotin-[acetyl-CoA-carboxylase] ligase